MCVFLPSLSQSAEGRMSHRSSVGWGQWTPLKHAQVISTEIFLKKKNHIALQRIPPFSNSEFILNAIAFECFISVWKNFEVKFYFLPPIFMSV